MYVDLWQSWALSELPARVHPSKQVLGTGGAESTWRANSFQVSGTSIICMQMEAANCSQNLGSIKAAPKDQFASSVGRGSTCASSRGCSALFKKLIYSASHSTNIYPAFSPCQALCQSQETCSEGAGSCPALQGLAQPFSLRGWSYHCAMAWEGG